MKLSAIFHNSHDPYQSIYHLLKIEVFINGQNRKLALVYSVLNFVETSKISIKKFQILLTPELTKKIHRELKEAFAFEFNFYHANATCLERLQTLITELPTSFYINTTQ